TLWRVGPLGCLRPMVFKRECLLLLLMYEAQFQCYLRHSRNRLVSTIWRRWRGCDDLKRYRDAGVEEIALLGSGRARTEGEMIAGLEQMAREFVEPAAKL